MKIKLILMLFLSFSNLLFSIPPCHSNAEVEIHHYVIAFRYDVNDKMPFFEEDNVVKVKLLITSYCRKDFPYKSECEVWPVDDLLLNAILQRLNGIHIGDYDFYFAPNFEWKFSFLFALFNSKKNNPEPIQAPVQSCSCVIL